VGKYCRAGQARPQMAIWRMRIACWITKATRARTRAHTRARTRTRAHTHARARAHTHTLSLSLSLFAVLIALPLQQRLHERAPQCNVMLCYVMLCYTYSTLPVLPVAMFGCDRYVLSLTVCKARTASSVSSAV
jgi:hypothetical protein